MATRLTVDIPEQTTAATAKKSPDRGILGHHQPGQPVDAYWADAADVLQARLASHPNGLSSVEASARLARYGPNTLREYRRLSRLTVLVDQVRSPLLLLLVFAAAASGLTGEWVDAAIVISIVLATVVVGYSREYSAQSAAAALRARIHARVRVLRDGQTTTVPAEEVVPGDVVLLAAGSLVPADGVVLDAADCYVSQAVLTGESFPVSKRPGARPAAAPLVDRINCVYLGTNVRSGTARVLIIRTGASTEFGSIARRLVLRPPETEFDRGIRHFGYLLTSAMVLLVLLVFTAHALRGRPPVETLLFSIALAVGLSPELLPAILSVNLARSARAMANRGVLVRRLNAIENLGSMDVLCTDKTGTLTEGVVRLEGAYSHLGEASTAPLALAAVNAAVETGLANPLDDAILEAHHIEPDAVDKLAEVPFDFARKRVTVVVREGQSARLITKGAFTHVLEVSTRTADGLPIDDRTAQELRARYEDWSRHGVRVIAVATRLVGISDSYDRGDEHDMTFEGFVTFLDRPKIDAAETIGQMARLGVAVKVISGDSRAVVEHIASLVGLTQARTLTGADLDLLNEEALPHAAEQADLFVEVDPGHKERIILALKKRGHVVGFLGDGVNDAPAMHAADTSLSVEQAVDVAREAADFVLLEHGLDVIRGGIEAGRTTFANTLKYILTTTSANFGNMISMAAASLFLPFLPLTAGQILLNNFLSDIPAIGLADDAVDPEMVERPERWNMASIARFMLGFGAVSSLFDIVTFGALLLVFQASPQTFRTAWFVESLLTELVVALVVRTRRRFYRSRPGTLLLQTTIGVVALAVAIPYLPLASFFGFVPLPLSIMVAIAAITCAYVMATEISKSWLLRRSETGSQALV